MFKYFAIAFFSIAIFSCEKPTKRLESLPMSVTNIDFENRLTSDESFNIVDYLYFYNGGGVAVGDVNNDGLQDIYFTGNQVENKLYLNKGNLKFDDITKQANVASPGPWKTGVAMADVNADGFVDIYVSRVGKYLGINGKNELFINNGDLTFTERAKEYGLDFSGFSTHAAFFDFDNDNDLDVYLLNHSVHTERSYGNVGLRNDVDSLAGDRLLRNDKGYFVDVSEQAGIYQSHIGYGLGVGIADVDNNGYPDIYIGNDFHENDYLYLNNGDGSFTENIHEQIQHTSRSSMGNDLADFNNDGLIDIISLDMLPEDEVVLKNSAGEDAFDIYQLKLSFGYERQFARNTLQINNGNNSFSEVGLMAGVAATDWSWSALFADLDNDGLKDLFISNGIVKRPNDLDYINFISNEKLISDAGDSISDASLIEKMPSGSVPNQVFRNTGNLSFENVSEKWGISEASVSNGTAYADLDNDGDLDIVINNIDQSATIIENRTSALGKEVHYIKVDFKGPVGNPMGIGAKIRLFSPLGLQFSEMYLQRGYQSSLPAQLHFGLDSIAIIDSLICIWPDGKKELLTNVEVDKTIIIDYNKAKSVQANTIKLFPLFEDVTEKVNLKFRHYENLFSDFNQQFLIPHEISKEGPAIEVGDVNGDKLEDVYISGASNNNGMLFVQKGNGTFEKHSADSFRSQPIYEEVDAKFIDVDNDNDLDLYLSTAGNEHASPSPKIKDQLMLNDGFGNYENASVNLPDLYINSSVIAPSDVDGDGDMDVFVGGRVRSGKYGLPADSHLYLNFGGGKYKMVTDERAPGLKRIGMVTDAAWADINGDGKEDLIVVGEWMSIKVFINNEGQLIETDYPSLQNTHGWWNTIEKVDLNNDGKLDFILGNQGINGKHVPTQNDPLSMYLADFDKNGFLDQVITYSIEGKEYPLASKDELVKQLAVIKKQYLSYASYAGKTIDEIVKRGALEASIKLKAATFESIALLQTATGFEVVPLPRGAQKSPINAILPFDFNKDGFVDLMIAGNKSGAAPYFGSYDASYGDILVGKGNGHFEMMNASKTLLKIDGDVRDLAVVNNVEYGKLIIVGRNNETVQVLSLRRD